MMAIRVLLDAGVKEENITFVNLVACPAGVQVKQRTEILQRFTLSVSVGFCFVFVAEFV